MKAEKRDWTESWDVGHEVEREKWERWKQSWEERDPLYSIQAVLVTTIVIHNGKRN